MDYTFPFTTCERPVRWKGFTAQPYSASVNAISAAVLARLATTSTTLPVRVAIASYAVLEAWHSFSHAVHIPGKAQTLTIHILNYVATICSILAISSTTGATLTIGRRFLVTAMAVEMMTYAIRKKDQLAVVAGTALFAFSWIIGYRHFSDPQHVLLHGAAFTFAIGVAVFLLEHRHCEALQKKHPFPYHVVIEVLTMAFLTLISVTLLREERK